MHANGAVRRFPLKRKLLKQGERAEKAGGRVVPEAGKRLDERMGIMRQPEHSTGKAGVKRAATKETGGYGDPPLRRGRGLVRCNAAAGAQHWEGGRPTDAPTAGKGLGERMGVMRQPEHSTGKAGIKRAATKETGGYGDPPLRRERGLVRCNAAAGVQHREGGRPKDAPTAGKRLDERMGECGSRSTAQGRRALKGPLQRRRAGTETRPYGGKDSLVAKSPSNKTGGYGGHNLQ